MNSSTLPKAMLAACFALAHLSAHAAWSITDLGTLGGSFSQAFDINDAGQIVGASGDASGNTRAFLYGSSGMADLGTLGGASATAYGINNFGQIVGGSATATGDTNAFLYSGGTMTNLGVLGGYASTAYAINDAGQVVGQSTLRPFNPQAMDPNTYGFLYQNGGMTQLSDTAYFSSARAINSSGEITGYQNAPNTIPPRPNATIFSNGNVNLLGTLEGPSPNPASPFASSIGLGINDAGQVVGASSVNLAQQEHAFLYTNGQMTDLGTLAGFSNSRAVGINNLGQIIGTSSGWTNNNTTLESHAFLYDKGSFTDLSSLAEVKAAGWTIDTVSAINNLGQIVGFGSFQGQQRGFLLSALAAPEIDGANGLLGISILAGLLSLRKKKTPSSV